MKTGEIEIDPTEKNQRRMLNYGHTMGHAVESASGFDLLHGEAVAIGMVMANAVAVALGWMHPEEHDRVRDLLEKYGLPTHYAIKDVEQFYETFYLDKKSADSAITFILPQHIGAVKITDSVDAKLIKDVLATFREA